MKLFTSPLALLSALFLAACGNVVVDPPGSGEASGDDGQGEAPPAAEYTVGYAQGPDHVIVRKTDREADRCVRLYAISPPLPEPGLDVETPEGWSVTHADIAGRAADCEAPWNGAVSSAVLATGATGTLSWETEPGSFVLCNLRVDVTVTSADQPATHHLLATGLSLGGECP